MNCCGSKKIKKKNVVNEKRIIQLEKAKTDAKFNFYHAKYEQALACYDCAIRLDSTDEVLFYNKGLCLLNLGRNQEAIKAFDQALNLNYLLEWYLFCVVE